MDYEAEITDIEATEIHGNFYQDSVLWSRCDRIVLDGYAPMDARIRAIRVIDRITGEPQGEVTEQDVHDHVAGIKEMLGL